jgi:hypothetical protein
MRGRTQFWLGSVSLALVLGLLLGGFGSPRSAVGQEPGAIANRYALVTGIPGTTRRTQTLYLVDDATDILYVMEYRGRSHDLEFRTAISMRAYAQKVIKGRAKREERGQR